MLTVYRCCFQGFVQFAITISLVQLCFKTLRAMSQAEVHGDGSKDSIEKRERPWHHIPSCNGLDKVA